MDEDSKSSGSEAEGKVNQNESREDLYRFQNAELFRAVCGVADRDVATIESILGIELIPRGQSFILKSEDREIVQRAKHFFRLLEERFGGRDAALPDRFDLEYIYRHMEEDPMDSSPSAGKAHVDPKDLLKEKIFTTHRGRSIFPRTLNQARYIQSILENSITFGLGPAGTGKTFLGILAACRMLRQGDVERIILTRPAVEAGESLGFLPGDLAQKVDPYLRPVYDALYECFGMERVNEMIASHRIEIAPLAYMRGRTLNNSFIVLDEAQNCTLAQLKMFLTRLGKDSRMCIGGDETQVDLTPGKSGLLKSVELLRGIQGIGVVHFDRGDIIRNPIVEKVVQAFERVSGREG